MREEEAGDQRKEGQNGIPTPGMDVLIGPLRSGMRDMRDMIKGGRMCGPPPQAGQRGLAIRPILSRYKKRELHEDRKEESCRGREVYFFSG